MEKKSPSARGPLTAKGMATRAAILDRAHQVFKETGYFGTSISEITRRCGISMGNFYQYFKNKEQVFLELNDLILSRFLSRAETLSFQTTPFDERLEKAVQLLYEHGRENFAFHRILGESELLDRVTIAYYETIVRPYRDFFRREARAGNIRPLDPNMIGYGLIGICSFLSMDWGEKEKTSPRDVVRLIVDLILYGISGPAPWKKPPNRNLFSIPNPLPLRSEEDEPLTKGEKTRQTIFQAAERVFGRLGINRANISEITREAGVAQGTFYVHFGSKGDLIEGFVKYINNKMRRDLQRTVATTKDRRDTERVGLLAFFEFLREHREIYRVVPECEMIDPKVSLWYYKRVAQGYIQGLQQGVDKREIRNLPAVFLGRSIMGLIHFIGLKWIVWSANSHPKISSPVLKDIVEFVLYGLKPQ